MYKRNMQPEISPKWENSSFIKISILNFVNKHCHEASDIADLSQDYWTILRDTFSQMFMTFIHSWFNNR